MKWRNGYWQARRVMGAIGFLFVFFLALELGYSEEPEGLKKKIGFQFQPGQIYRYKLEQNTNIVEITRDDPKAAIQTISSVHKLQVVKRWKILEVAANGDATIELSIEKMRMERQIGNDKATIFDSESEAKDSKEETAQLKKMINTKIVVLQVNRSGDFIKLVESKFGSKNRFVTDLPFKLVLSSQELKKDTTWDRKYKITLDPPQGAGESFDATQNYTVLVPTNGLESIQVQTEIKDYPKDANLQIALLPTLQNGTIYFHSQTGRYYGSRLTIEKNIDDYQGPGTKYRYACTLSEDLLDVK